MKSVLTFNKVHGLNKMVPITATVVLNLNRHDVNKVKIVPETPIRKYYQASVDFQEFRYGSKSWLI